MSSKMGHFGDSLPGLALASDRYQGLLHSRPQPFRYLINLGTYILSCVLTSHRLDLHTYIQVGKQTNKQASILYSIFYTDNKVPPPFRLPVLYRRELTGSPHWFTSLYPVDTCQASPQFCCRKAIYPCSPHKLIEVFILTLPAR
ncbi:uncharacterized protein FMAN_04483 [Fusarium mangiferae]|uniref:Uncharacterized protein n=1 Tax=Fusarium mangiferae TaxID=192010 RepID=A0A1L7T1G5_FUSMA|nr:uncharacterized protein FMAN_04483 [Fusarium mangiferae]CVK89161.1 uncharacterized protein FMAN_04483 [Fusarium mangiferae]